MPMKIQLRESLSLHYSYQLHWQLLFYRNKFIVDIELWGRNHTINECEGFAVTIENHSIIGGLGSAVCECLAESAPCKVLRIGVNDIFGQSGTPEELLKYYGLDAESIASKVIELKKWYN